MSAIDRRALLGLLGALVVNVGCRSETAKPAQSANKKLRLDAVEVFPADLDVVFRIDVARMRAALGPAADDLSKRMDSQLESHDELASRAMQRARVAWIGTRIADIESGDRVLVIEGDVEDLRPDADMFRVIDPPLADGLTTYERRGPLARDATAQVHLLGPQKIAFVSGVEVDGVMRVLQRGPDPERRDPPADGLLSADLRARRLSPDLERRFPSIAAVIRGVKRAKVGVTIVDDGVRAEVEISAASETASKKVENLLSALRDAGQEGRYADLFANLRIERVEQAVQIRWTVPLQLLRGFLPDH